MATKKLSPVKVLNSFFNGKDEPNHVKLISFGKEIKALDPAEKQEMAVLAAEALGLTQDDVTFDLVLPE